MIKRKRYLDQINNFIDKPIIKVLTGMRRSGKSTIMKLLIDELIQKGIANENIVYINKESLRYDFIKDYQDLNFFVLKKLKNKTGKKYILIDEIQEIEKWEKVIVSFLADNVGDIIISGSNAHMLSSELATLISGRYVEIPIYTLNFKEFLLFRKIKNDKDLEKELQLYIRYGGLPGIHNFKFRDETVFTYLNSILNTVLLKDVILKNSIRDANTLEKITQYLMDNCGNITTAKKISDYFKSQRVRISVDTVQNYIDFLKNAFLFYRVKRFDLKGKKYLEYGDKLYIGDIGLRNGFIGHKDSDISAVIENLVFLELIKRGYSVSIGNRNRKEIDFIAQKNKTKIYLQVCYLLGSEKTIQREFGNLESIKDNYRKIVISFDKYFPSNQNGIEHLYIIDFLVNGLKSNGHR